MIVRGKQHYKQPLQTCVLGPIDHNWCRVEFKSRGAGTLSIYREVVSLEPSRSGEYMRCEVLNNNAGWAGIPVLGPLASFDLTVIYLQTFSEQT